jgi:uncharacterized protein
LLISPWRIDRSRLAKDYYLDECLCLLILGCDMWDTFLMAIALMLVLEGILPFVSPNAWRETFQKLLQLEDGQIRFIGLSAMLVGLIILYLIN